jgi:hypothetical protein
MEVTANRGLPPRLFPTPYMGGFECSVHLSHGRRLDLLASTRHDQLAAADYRRLLSVGMGAARDGIRWHRVERAGGYDWSSVRPMVQAALAEGIAVTWDLLHFGWPDDVDVLAPDFPERFARFAAAFGELLREEGDPAPSVVPVNEISFLSFAGGEAGFFNPFLRHRGDALKRALVSGAIAASRAIRRVLPGVRLVHTDPVIHVHARRPEHAAAAAAHRDAQFHAWDMLMGRRAPELGGSPELVDAIGVNYYIHNQWYWPGGHGSVLPPSHPESRPVHELLLEVHRRYDRPMLIAETGIEDDARAPWLRFISWEARAAIRRGADLQSICLYPVVNHPGWEDDRHCYNGLWDYADAGGNRPIDVPLARELERQQELMRRLADDPQAPEEPRPSLEGLDPVAREIAEVTERSRER